MILVGAFVSKARADDGAITRRSPTSQPRHSSTANVPQLSQSAVSCDHAVLGTPNDSHSPYTSNRPSFKHSSWAAPLRDSQSAWSRWRVTLSAGTYGASVPTVTTPPSSTVNLRALISVWLETTKVPWTVIVSHSKREVPSATVHVCPGPLTQSGGV